MNRDLTCISIYLCISIYFYIFLNADKQSNLIRHFHNQKESNLFNFFLNINCRISHTLVFDTFTHQLSMKKYFYIQIHLNIE